MRNTEQLQVTVGTGDVATLRDVARAMGLLYTSGPMRNAGLPSIPALMRRLAAAAREQGSDKLAAQLWMILGGNHE